MNLRHKLVAAAATATLAFAAAPSSAFAAEVDVVQTGVHTTLVDGATTVDIQDIDPTRSILFFQSRHDSNNRAGGQMLRGRILDQNTLQFVRNTSSADTVDVQWTVVTFSTGVSVQRGEVTQSSTSIDVTLPTPVSSVSQAFILWSKTPRAGEGPVDSDDPVLAELTDTSTLQFRTDNADAQHTIWWQVVEFTDPMDINVQTGTTALTGTELTDTITLGQPVDVNTTFVLCGFRSSGNGNDLEERVIRATLTDASTITVSRGDTGDNIEEVLCHAVELKDGSQVQSGTTSFNNELQIVETLDPFVDPNKAVAFASVQPYGGQNMGSIDANNANNIEGKGAFTFALSSDQLYIERNDNGDPATVSWSVVTFNGPYGGQGGGTQCGTTSLTGDGIASEAITAVNPTKSFLLLQGRHDSNRPPGSMVRGRLAAPDRVELELDTNGSETVNVSWCVVTYNYGIRVQRGEIGQNGTGGVVPVTISPIADRSQAFLLWSKTPNPTHNIWSLDDPIIGEIVDDTTIEFRAQELNSGHTISWEVVEFLNPADADVIWGTTSMAPSDTIITDTLPQSIDPATSFLLVGFSSGGNNTEVGRRMLTGRIVDANTVELERSVGGDPLPDITYQVVYLKEGSSVQHGVQHFNTGESMHTVSLPTSVDNTRTLPLASTQVVSGPSMGRTSYVGDDIAGVSSFTMSLPAMAAPSNQLVITRDSTVGDADVSWFVWQVPSQVLSVELIGFEATGHDRRVDLSWKTATEVDTVGYQVLRSTSVAGPFEPLGDLISAEAGIGASHTYGYTDYEVVNGTRYYYKLEEVTATSADRYGPVHATPDVELRGCACDVRAKHVPTVGAWLFLLGLVALLPRWRATR